MSAAMVMDERRIKNGDEDEAVAEQDASSSMVSAWGSYFRPLTSGMQIYEQMALSEHDRAYHGPAPGQSGRGLAATAGDCAGPSPDFIRPRGGAKTSIGLGRLVWLGRSFSSDGRICSGGGDVKPWPAVAAKADAGRCSPAALTRQDAGGLMVTNLKAAI